MKNKKIITGISIVVLVLIIILSIFYKSQINLTPASVKSYEEAVALIQEKNAELKNYPSDTPPISSIIAEDGQDGWYIAFVQENSNASIDNAKCFFVNKNGEINNIEFSQNNSVVNGEFSVSECKIVDAGTPAEENVASSSEANQ